MKNSPAQAARLTTVACRVHRMEAMISFYAEAFGVRFREVVTGNFRSHFGDLDGLTLKFVPIRAGVDFEDFPVHQLGFAVPDVDRAVAAALQHGGRIQNEPVRQGNVTVASVRDPDGNTLELYSFP